jgi:phage tail-like protein
MKTSLTKKYIQSRYNGLDVYQARRKIHYDFPDLDDKKIDIHYTESPYPRFTVLQSALDEKRGVIELQVSSNNPIRHLPTNYQADEFLRGFLMIFQHIMNNTSITLDNMHEYFRPMESPSAFLPVLADWFGIHLDTLGGEEEIRRFLQYAIPLYRYRGTVLGLKAHLAIVSGVIPEIIEGKIPYSSMIIEENTNIESDLMDFEDFENAFTIYFPVFRSHFDDTSIRRLSLIVQREKPVHSKAFIAFREPKRKQRNVTILSQETVLGSEDGGILF